MAFGASEKLSFDERDLTMQISVLLRTLASRLSLILKSHYNIINHKLLHRHPSKLLQQ